MAARYVLAIDQGTTGSTALLIDRAGAVRGRGYAELPQHFPRPGWVEHDGSEIWATVLEAVRGALRDARARGADVAAIGITNQRETTLLWDRASGRPVARAIVWQDRRTEARCAELKRAGLERDVRRRTRPRPRSLLFGDKDRVAADARPHAGAARARPRDRVRHRGQLADLEAHRRRRARDRSHECIAHDAVQPEAPRLG